MIVRADGTVVGSVSGGCVEGAVYESLRAVMESGGPHIERYGISDEDAFSVGLPCGGIIEVFIDAVSPEGWPDLDVLARLLDNDEPVAVATVIAHPDAALVGRREVVTTQGSWGNGDEESAARLDDVRALLAVGASGRLTYAVPGQGDATLFVTSFVPKPRMLVFGSTDIASALVRQASALGYHVTVCDARPVFATAERFPEADELVIAWPHLYVAEEMKRGKIDARTVMCVLTHDTKFDIPLLSLVLGADDAFRPGFIGAMGSRSACRDRLDRLRTNGLGGVELARLTSPFGLDLGGRTPQETALSMLAEVVAARSGGSGLPLSVTTGRIHHDFDKAPMCDQRGEALSPAPGH